MATETTLILLKPDCVSKNLVGTVISRIEAEGFTLCGVRMLQCDDDLLTEHYSHIADKPFFPEILEFMKSEPVIALALKKENAIDDFRTVLGITNSAEAAEGTIRKEFGVNNMINVCHASDSPENAAIELKRFFPNGGIFDR